MRILTALGAAIVVGLFSVSAADAACTGSNGRGWGSGAGAGKFQMSAGDKECRIGFTNVIKGSTQIPATKVTVTRAPKSGKVSVTGKGLLYTPAKGFKGQDRFCTRNTTPKAPGVTLSGCITVTVK